MAVFCRSIPGSVPESFLCLLAPRLLNGGVVTTTPVCTYQRTYRWSTCGYRAVFLWLAAETWPHVSLRYSSVVEPVLCSEPARQHGLETGPVTEWFRLEKTFKVIDSERVSLRSCTAGSHGLTGLCAVVPWRYSGCSACCATYLPF